MSVNSNPNHRFCFCSSNQTGKHYFYTLVLFYYFFFLVFILILVYFFFFFKYFYSFNLFWIAFAYHLHDSFKVTHPHSESFCFAHYFQSFLSCILWIFLCSSPEEVGSQCIGVQRSSLWVGFLHPRTPRGAIWPSRCWLLPKTGSS